MQILDSLFGRYRRVFLGYLALVIAYFVVAATVSARNAGEIFSLSSMLRIPSVALIPVLGFAMWVGLLTVFRRYDRPTATLYRLMKRNWRWIIRSTILLATIYGVASGAFMALKVAIPRIVPFYADPYLAAIDRVLLLGNEAWDLSHSVFGPTATIWIGGAYSLWFASLTVISLWAAFDRDIRFQLRASITYVLTWMLLGNILATALSSVGPIYFDHFFGGEAYAPLLDKLEIVPRTLFIRGYLLENYGKEVLGSGISAAPSLHVAITVLLVLMSRERFGWNWVTASALLYALMILLGSVHLGWHYLVDGIMAILLTPLIWQLSGWLIDRYSLPNNVK